MPREETIRVVVKKPQLPAVELHIPNTLQSFQRLVKGYVEAVYVDGTLSLYCNEEGKLKDLPLNFPLNGDVICGTAVFTATDEEGEQVSLSDEQVKQALAIARD
jgi:hypothetical protein